MVPGAILAQAKQGNPEAIALFLNHHLGKPGVKVRTRRQDACLEILLETDAEQDLQDFKAMIQQAIAELAPASIQRVKLYGKRVVEPKPTWSDEFSLPHRNDASSSAQDLSEAITRQARPRGQMPKPATPSPRTVHPVAPRPRPAPNRTILVTLIVLLLQAVVIAALVFGLKQQPRTATSSQTPVAATTSEIALAQHLTATGVKMYGTYWCGVCQAQFGLFGEQASKLLNYIECDPAGPKAQPDVCAQAGVRAYPTWEIAGQFYPGGFSLPDLADASRYEGPRNFVNPNPW